MITNVLWPSQRLRRRAWDSVLLRTRAQLLGKRVGGNLHSSGGMKTPSDLAQGSLRNWRERDGLRWTGDGAALGRGCQAICCENSEPEGIMSSLELG